MIARLIVDLDDLLRNHYEDILASTGYNEDAEAENGTLFGANFEQSLIFISRSRPDSVGQEKEAQRQTYSNLEGYRFRDKTTATFTFENLAGRTKHQSYFHYFGVVQPRWGLEGEI